MCAQEEELQAILDEQADIVLKLHNFEQGKLLSEDMLKLQSQDTLGQLTNAQLGLEQ